MEYVFVNDSLFAPTQTYKMPTCKCKKDNVDAETITERDDFIYDKCMTCGKMIEGSARPWPYED